MGFLLFGFTSLVFMTSVVLGQAKESFDISLKVTPAPCGCSFVLGSWAFGVAPKPFEGSPVTRTETHTIRFEQNGENCTPPVWDPIPTEASGFGEGIELAIASEVAPDKLSAELTGTMTINHTVSGGWQEGTIEVAVTCDP